ncbi:MAG: hypothetical protein JWM86_1471 [Thermoleophilia bacterium]|nr:hypothetical protein [Thermoleophilia bacterium]
MAPISISTRARTGVTAALALIVALLASLAVAPSANAVLLEGDYSTAIQRREGHQPSLGAKMLGYSALTTAAGNPPDVVIVGTSRAVQLDPRLIKQLSGRTAYNFGTSDGAAREVLAVSSFVEMLTPGDAPHLVIMFDIEGLDRRTPTRRVMETIATLDAARGACSEAITCADQWRATARDLLRTAREGQEGMPPYRSVVRYDGMQINGNLEKLDRQGVDMVGIRNRRIAIRIRSYRPDGGFNRLMPIPMAAIRRAIVTANARGDAPTIVITSMHPECIRRCGPAGWYARRVSARAFLKQLDRTLDMTVIDASDPRTWGGGSSSFFDEIHLRPAAAAKLVRWLDAKRVFEVQPTPALVSDASAARTKVSIGSDDRGFLERGLATLTLVARG